MELHYVYAHPKLCEYGKKNVLFNSYDMTCPSNAVEQLCNQVEVTNTKDCNHMELHFVYAHSKLC